MAPKTKAPMDAIALLKEDHATVRELMDKDELQTLGEQLARRKRELQAADGDSADESGEEEEDTD